MKFIIALAALYIGCATAVSPIEIAFSKWTIEKDCPEITDVKKNFDVKAVSAQVFNQKCFFFHNLFV
jgi:hypothetical protein